MNRFPLLLRFGRTPRLAIAFLAVAGLSASAGCSAWLRGHSELDAIHAAREPNAGKIGDENCLDCHTTIQSFVESSIHAKNPGCETCHGPGELHASDGPGHIATAHDLRSMTPRGQSSMCTQCHVDRRATFPSSPHAKAGLTCFQCHTDAVHFKQANGVRPPSQFVDAPNEFCKQCHAKDVEQTAQPFRHPMDDGEVGCADCHAVHGEDALQADLRPGAACAKCHADEAGPKVFRHAALDDGCSVCHATHGSAVPGLLRESGNGLCLSCHLEPGFPVIEGVDHRDNLANGAQCLDCHVEIHGSDSDPSLLGRIR